MYGIASNKKYSFLATARPVYRYGFTGLCMSFGMLFWFVVVRSAMHQVKDAYALENTALQREYLLLEQYKTTVTQEEADVAQLQQCIDVCNTHIVSADQCLESVWSLAELMHKHALVVQECRLLAEQQHDWFVAHTVALTLQGSLSSLAAMLHELVASNNLMTCSEITFNRQDEKMYRCSGQFVMHILQ